MNQLPPYVMECLECGEKYLIYGSSNIPSENAKVFSDGFFIDATNWRTPEVIGCVTCELGFFLKDGKVIAEPSWKEFNEKWSDLKKATPPPAGALALEIRARKKMKPDEELALRKEFWYAGVHTDLGQRMLLNNAKFNKFWNESLQKLETLIETNSEKNILLKAECNRQLGNFEKCKDLLAGENSKIAQLMVNEAQKQNTEVFVIK